MCYYIPVYFRGCNHFFRWQRAEGYECRRHKHNLGCHKSKRFPNHGFTVNLRCYRRNCDGTDHTRDSAGTRGDAGAGAQSMTFEEGMTGRQGATPRNRELSAAAGQVLARLDPRELLEGGEDVEGGEHKEGGEAMDLD